MVDATNTGLVRAVINMSDTDVGNNPNDKNSGEEYFDRRQNEENNKEQFKQSEFMDRSAQLRATLTSLASLNAASVIKTSYKDKEKQKKEKLEKDKKEEEKEEQSE